MNKTLLSKLREQERTLTNTAKALSAQIRALESEGLTDGKPTWNSGKYLYMYHPNPKSKGGRDRRYVGSDPVKVQAALEAVDRTAKHQTLMKKYNATEALINRIGEALDRLRHDVAAGIEQFGLDDLNN